LRKLIRRASWDCSHGVYFLFLKQELVYVGRSSNPYGRIEAHRINGRPFDDFTVAHCEPGQSMWMERALIASLAPAQNRAGKPMHDPLPPPKPAPEPKTQIVTQVVYRDRIVTPKTDADEMCSISSWKYALTRYGLRKPFADAVTSGEIPSFWKNPEFTGPGQRKLVRRGDVEAWVDARQKERRAA
jgi:hypothetical protein